MLHHLIQALTHLENAIENNTNGTRVTDHEGEVALQLFQRVWSKIPAEWKLRCQSSLRDSTLNPSRDRLRVDLWSRETIIVPNCVLTTLRLWDNDPSSFFVVKLESPPSNDPFTRLFRLLHDASGGDPTIKAIRLRFGQIGLSRLRDRLELCQLKDGICEKEFLDRIQSNGDSAEISKAKTWATIGRRYDSLSSELGGLGSMICMPQDVSSAKLERIPLVGDSRTEAIKCLQHRGINNQTISEIKSCYDVAEKIARVMQEESDSFFLQYKPPSQVPRQSIERKRKRKSDHGRSQRRQGVEQESNRDHQGSTSSMPDIGTSLDPRAPAQATSSLNVGFATAGQNQGIDNPNSAIVLRLPEAHDLEVEIEGTSTRAPLCRAPLESPKTGAQTPSLMLTQVVADIGTDSQTSKSRIAGQEADSIPAISDEEIAVRSEWIDNGLTDTLLDSSGTLDLADFLIFPMNGIDLASYLFHQEMFGDTAYLPYHHDEYTDSRKPEGMIAGQADGIIAGVQSLGSPVPG